jgi:transposase
LELSRKQWKLGFSDGKRPQIRKVTIQAGDMAACGKEIGKAKQRFGMKESAEVRSCYEAGREGFWPHRALTEMGVANIVVVAASIEINRRQRRAKTDRMDVEKLVRQLVRYWRGEQDVWRIVRVPSVESEDGRQLHRELEVLKEERKQHRVRIQSVLFTHGVDMSVRRNFMKKLEGVRCCNGEPIPPELRRRIENEYHRLQLAEAQIREIQKAQAEKLKAGSTDAVMQKVGKLQRLVSLGLGSSWVFVMELFGWRTFRNRREGQRRGPDAADWNRGDGQTIGD